LNGRKKTEKLNQPYFISKQNQVKKESTITLETNIKPECDYSLNTNLIKPDPDFIKSENQISLDAPIKLEPNPLQNPQAPEPEKPIMYLAGLYDLWTNTQTGELLYSYTIITTNAHNSFSWLHDRMPAILTEAEIVPWLTAPLDQALALLRPTDGVEIYPVSSQVGNFRNDSPNNIKPIILKTEPKNTIQNYFLKKRKK